ncbi:MAG: sodium/proton-translocating pyrophosphatase, partial [Butyricicoccus sp.]|nr:sodium/proton-translocating pyrophosphatase [Butyricicoccus sp.]
MDQLFLLGFLGAAIAGIFAAVQTRKVLSYSEGTQRMQQLAAFIRQGANAYLKQQYTSVLRVFVVVFVVLLLIANLSGGRMLSRYTPFAFITGGVFSMLAGFIGM